jgi:hypothetical protein
MSILHHIHDQSTFDPEEIQAMATAFELACADLKIFAGDDRGRQVVATRIIDLARRGVADPETLHRLVVADAGLSM